MNNVGYFRPYTQRKMEVSRKYAQYVFNLVLG